MLEPRNCRQPRCRRTYPLDRKLCVPGFRRVYPDQRAQYRAVGRRRQAIARQRFSPRFGRVNYVNGENPEGYRVSSKKR